MNLHFVVLLILLSFVLTMFCFGQNSELMFPLYRSMAGDRELPKPYGLGITYHYQKQDYDLAKLMVSLPGIDIGQAADAVKVENNTTEVNLKFDLWLLPFLNIFAIIGHVEGETEVQVPLLMQTLEIDYDGLVYGAGVTLAAGYKDFFGLLTMLYTETDLDVSTSSVDAFIVSPRVGYKTGFGQIWIGAMYQHTEEKHEGTIILPQFGKINFDVELEEKDPWNYLAGVKIDIRKNLDLEIEGGIGERKQVTASLTYRF